VSKTENKFLDDIQVLKPLRNANIPWQRNGRRVLLMLPWPKNILAHRHIRPIDATGIAKVVMLKPLIDEIWLKCDGEHTVGQICEEIKSQYPQTKMLTFDYIASKINMLAEKGWLTLEE